MGLGVGEVAARWWVRHVQNPATRSFLLLFLLPKPNPLTPVQCNWVWSLDGDDPKIVIVRDDPKTVIVREDPKTVTAGVPANSR